LAVVQLVGVVQRIGFAGVVEVVQRIGFAGVVGVVQRTGIVVVAVVLVLALLDKHMESRTIPVCKNHHLAVVAVVAVVAVAEQKLNPKGPKIRPEL
jgi:hypothetical protein